VLRFLAAASVAFTHLASLLVDPTPLNAWMRSVPWAGGVDLFFVISGFIMFYLSQGSFGAPGAALQFIKRRIIRIVPSYWFFTTITIFVVLILGGRVGGTTIDSAQVITSYGFVPWPRADGQMNPIVSQGWTLNYEAFFYLMFAAGLVIRRGIAIIFVAFTMLALVHPFVPENIFILKFWSDPIILEFLGGIALARIYLSGVRLRPAGAVACAVSAIFLFVAMSGLPFGEYQRFVQVGMPAILLSASLILSPEPAELGLFRKWLQRCGDASYTTYLSHYMVVNAFAIVWNGLSIGMPWVGVALGMGSVILTGLFFYRNVERPVTNALRRRLGEGRPPTAETAAP